MIMDLQSPAIALKSPPAICWTKNTSSRCLKNLHTNTKLSLYKLLVSETEIVKRKGQVFYGPVSLWSKSYGVVCDKNPDYRFNYGEWDSENDVWQCEDPSRVKEEVSVLVEHW